jgi:hypothetical protein
MHKFSLPEWIGPQAPLPNGDDPAARGDFRPVGAGETIVAPRR